MAQTDQMRIGARSWLVVIFFKTRRKHHNSPVQQEQAPQFNNNNKSFLLAHCHIYGKQLRSSLLNNKSNYLGTYSTGNTVESQGDADRQVVART